MQPWVIELADDKNNLHRKAIRPAGCLGMIEKIGQAWLGRGLWFAAGVVTGIILWSGRA